MLRVSWERAQKERERKKKREKRKWKWRTKRERAKRELEICEDSLKIWARMMKIEWRILKYHRRTDTRADRVTSWASVGAKKYITKLKHELKSRLTQYVQTTKYHYFREKSLTTSEIRFSDFDFHKKTNKNLHTVYSVIAKEIICATSLIRKV